ncbi:MAG: DNA polymerase III subunit alpha [Paludibacteraceae bacterium]|nr:DNA polymerase III subunit alpha [Paludibacteraceae bacterium]
MSFVHLHVHSHYSLLDGMSTIPDLVNKAIATGMPAIALTDHGNMFGVKEFFDFVSKKNKGKEPEKQLKPIIGCEAYVATNKLTDKKGDVDRSGDHLILLAKNKVGYKNLCKLVSISWIDGFYYRPRIDKESLKKYSEGLIVCSACLGGEIPQHIMNGKPEKAEEAIRWFKDVFGDDYYLELQRHKTTKPNADYTTYEKQLEVSEHIIALAQKTATKIIATNDVHFVEEEHAEAHERLICLSTGKDLDDPSRMRYTKQEWLKTPEEMAAIFSDVPEVLSTTLEIAQKVEFYDINADPIMPMFPIPEEFGTEEAYRKKYSEEDLKNEFGDRYEKLGGYEKVVRIKLEADYLRELTLKGAKNRYGENYSPDLQERIDFELNTMKTMGFPGYFLIVQDFIQAARDMAVSVGPGRGSAAGSVVAYCLKITDIDPLKYDLLFERFLNPDRISMPDIDIDFDDDGRIEVLRWVTEKYGKEKVAQIITYGTMATKSSIKDVARVQNLPLSDAERITKLIPMSFPEDTKTGETPKVNISNCIAKIPELQREIETGDDNLKSTMKYAQMLEGTVRQTGVHACGVIIGADDLTNFVPLSTAKEKGSDEDIRVTQYEGSVIEQVGLIKMDFLGLKNLSIIKEALKNIQLSKGVDIDIDAIPIDDEKTYQLYSKGLTTGTFQFESPGMQKHLKELQPTRFEDLIAMNALYRPGPMQYIPQFINRKHGREEITYDFPEMEGRLKETYGITVYQEQVMLLSRDLAGFTRGQSDELRKAMGKKMKDKMESLKVKFIEGATERGFGPKEKLEKIWADWSEFAKYAFNKSHAVCYSWIAYQTAYLKANYPAEYMAANLTRNKGDISDVTKFMDDCKLMGIPVLGPDINESALNFVVNAKGEIRFGLGGVKGVGEGAVEAIVIEREKNGLYKNVFDFIERVNLNACNRKTVESLALSGAFDSIDTISREQFMAENAKGEIVLDAIMRYGNKFQNDVSLATNTLFGEDDAVDIVKPEIPKVEPWSPIEKLNKEKELVGIYLSAHPLDDYYIELNRYCNATTSDMKDLSVLQGKELKLAGMINTFRNGTTKTGNSFGAFTLEDFSGNHEFMLFGKDYVEYSKYLKKDLCVILQGRVQERGADWKFAKKTEGPPQLEFKIKRMSLLDELDSSVLQKLTLSFTVDNLDEEFANDLIAIIKDNKGSMSVYFTIKDAGSTIALDMFSRGIKIELNNQVKQFLREKQHLNQLEFLLE